MATGKDDKGTEISDEERRRAELLSTRESTYPIRVVIQKNLASGPDAIQFSVTPRLAPSLYTTFEWPFEADQVVQDTIAEGPFGVLTVNLAEALLPLPGVVACTIGKYDVEVFKGAAFDWDDIMADILRTVCLGVYKLDVADVEILFRHEEKEGEDDPGGDGPIIVS